VIGGNAELEYRWTEGNPDYTRKYIAELVALAPDVIVAQGATAVRAISQATRTVPIVFPVAGDPVGAGLVETLARPGGNVTGFMNFEYSTSGKWLELLKQIAPSVARVAVLRDPATPTGTAEFGVIQAAASVFRVDVAPINVRTVDDVELGVTKFAQQPNGGLIATTNLSVFEHRQRIIELADRHRLPAVYPGRLFAKGGGLVSYGPDVLDQYCRAADYVDRILKGEKPADLPVQAPTKYNLVINLRTAKALDLEVPAWLLVLADEVIE
jgi:putative ABC transport system substrate-binding protein